MINYNVIADSVTFYESVGFARVESPWTVSSQIANITKPFGATNFSILEKNKVLVASGEQSFLCMYNKGFLPKGMFQTVTPCFRDEQFDSLHTKYFIKNELIKTDIVTKDALQTVLKLAVDFFSKYLPSKYLDIVYLKDGSYDIMYEGIELGSYGIRRCDFLNWIYGTGVAEPRLSMVLKKYGIS
jgi:hypothetical protein